MQSLNLRLTLAASLVLAAFLGLAGWALDRAFRDSAEVAVRERLQAHIYGLLAAADLGPSGDLILPDTLPEERYQRPGSGLYAQVIQSGNGSVWQSPSTLGQTLPEPELLGIGEWRFSRATEPQAVDLFVLGFGTGWELEKQNLQFTFVVSEDLAAYRAQLTRFRTGLWGWFGALAVGLLLAQGFVLRWGLSPLRRAERDLAAVEAGAQDALSGTYPRELSGLTENLNALLRTERGRQARYRDALADLAHSLKTPLAVLRGATRQASAQHSLEQIVREQTERMGQIVDYQLQRAATSGRTTLMSPIAVVPVVQRVINTLNKVYADRHLELTVQADPALQFRGDESDLLELCGNLLDNACKWSRHRVHISLDSHRLDTGQELAICVEDDGPGIPEDQRAAVVARGVRVDSSVPGQGIGLAVVGDIAAAYGGAVRIDQSTDFGGARLVVTLRSG